ncbi:MAG: SDR family NAD(P)-dependent oxidoreductase [Dehalococcoidales bacterium]|nr:SDR family NAD(P)-dependent oxidoreductase [Dehalococcoidales bacterium]
MTDSFSTKYGPWALITGASRGLGAEFARQCAERGLNLVLIATNTELLKSQQKSLKNDYGVDVKVIPLDLSREDILPVITPATNGLEIGLLVNNAGVSKVHPFLQQPLDFSLKQLHVNSRAGLILTHHFSRKMVERRRGGIIFLSSGSAMYGTAYCANYAATKAYNLIIAETLWYELGGYGVDVLGFMAGSTKTPGWDANNPKPNRLVKVMDTKAAVTEALKALGKKPSHIAGTTNRLGYFFMGKVMSRSGAIRTLAKSMEKLFGPFTENT